MRGSCQRSPSFLVGATSRSRCLPGALWLSDALLILLIPLILKILIQTVNCNSSPDNVSGLRREVAIAFRQSSAYSERGNVLNSAITLNRDLLIGS